MRRPKVQVPLDVIAEQPFVRVTRNRVQLTMTRDTLAALGHPTHLLWTHNVKESVIRLIAADAKTEDAFVVSYGYSRPSGIVTIPGGFRPILSPGKYMVTSWSEKSDSPRWVQFGTVNPLIRFS